jgi:hypothetical protein
MRIKIAFSSPIKNSKYLTFFLKYKISFYTFKTVEKLGTFPSVKRGYTVPKLSSSPSYGVADGNNIVIVSYTPFVCFLLNIYKKAY